LAHQLSCQKDVVSQSPRVILVESIKSTMLTASQGSLEPAQECCGSVHWSQSHRRRSARPDLSRSSIPRYCLPMCMTKIFWHVDTLQMYL
jgi:hypothetical protein